QRPSKRGRAAGAVAALTVTGPCWHIPHPTLGTPATAGNRENSLPAGADASLVGTDQPVLKREQRRAGSRGHADLSVPALNVVVAGLRRYPQPTGDLFGGEPAGEQPEHLTLAPGQAGGPLHGSPRLARGDQDRVDCVGGELARRGVPVQ